MSGQPDWLPPLIRLEDHEGSWDRYIEAVYASFHDEFIRSQPRYEGCWVRCPRQPIVEGKEATFWHCVSEGLEEDQRTPDLRRTERIRLIRAIIEHADDVAVSRWVTRRGSRRLHVLWYREEYVVVLKGIVRTRDGFRYFVLKTAYCTTFPHTIKNLREERDAAGGDAR
jgi:hypothetical protein